MNFRFSTMQSGIATFIELKLKGVNPCLEIFCCIQGRYPRLNAIKEFLLLSESEDLASANKRVGNILKKADIKSTLKVSQSFLKDEAEINLYNTLDFVDAESRKEYMGKNYSGSLKLLCKSATWTKLSVCCVAEGSQDSLIE